MQIRRLGAGTAGCFGEATSVSVCSWTRSSSDTADGRMLEGAQMAARQRASLHRLEAPGKGLTRREDRRAGEKGARGRQGRDGVAEEDSEGSADVPSAVR